MSSDLHWEFYLVDYGEYIHVEHLIRSSTCDINDSNLRTPLAVLSNFAIVDLRYLVECRDISRITVRIAWRYNFKTATLPICQALLHYLLKMALLFSVGYQKINGTAKKNLRNPG